MGEMIPEIEKEKIDEAERIIRALITGTVEMRQDILSMRYIFMDIRGNQLEIDPDVYVRIVNYIEKECF